MMNNPISLRITHICGRRHQEDAVITLHRDALLDHEAFEPYLSEEQFMWLTHARCTVRCRSHGMSSAWWLQHGSHQYTCSINDQLIACSDNIMLHTGDQIEIGMIRMEVTDAAAIPVKPPALPPVIHDTTLPEISTIVPVSSTQPVPDDIPLLTDILAAETDDDLTTLFSSDQTALPEKLSEDDIFISLDKQYEAVMLQEDALNSLWTAVPDHSANLPLSAVPAVSAFAAEEEWTDDLSLEEALLGPLSVNQVLDHLTISDDETDLPHLTATNEEVPTDVLSLFADQSIYPKKTVLPVAHIHQSFSDSFCDLSSATTPLILQDPLSQHQET